MHRAGRISVVKQSASHIREPGTWSFCQARACSLSMAFSGSERTSGMVEPAIRWNSDRMSDADLHAYSKLLSKCGD